MGGNGAKSGKTVGIFANNEIVKDGKISLNVDDYKDYKGSEIRDFLSAQDYEVFAVFDGNDKIVGIHSDFREGSVRTASVIGALRKTDLTNTTHFHNHPMAGGTTVQMFSPEDVRTYANMVLGGTSGSGLMKYSFEPTLNKNGKPLVSKMQVTSQNGSKFVLEYTGVKTNSRTKSQNFAKAYSKAIMSRVDFYDSLDTIDSEMVKWTQKNGPKYGFYLKSTFNAQGNKFRNK